MQARHAAGFVLALAALGANAAGGAHWGYSGHGPAAWGEVPGAEACKLGKLQSPIDIRDAKKTGLPPLDLHYQKGGASIVDNGHTVQIDLADAGFLNVGGVPYKLVQFHFHAPSEEKIGGKGFPMVIHLVHKAADGKLAVVAVLLKEGKADAALAPLFTAMARETIASRKLYAGFDATEILPADKGYYKYVGSLTTPPCSEGVAWHVLKQPITVSKAQIETFRKHYRMNARPVQPLNDRVVEQS
jgi:carbonic anhydrase